MPVLECKGLTKRFGKVTALDEVELAIGAQRQRQDHFDQIGQRPADPGRGLYRRVRRRAGAGEP